MENLHITKVVRHGDSLGIIIPVEVLRGVGLQRGDTLLLGMFSPGQFTAALLSDEKIKQLKINTVRNI